PVLRQPRRLPELGRRLRAGQAGWAVAHRPGPPGLDAVLSVDRASAPLAAWMALAALVTFTAGCGSGERPAPPPSRPAATPTVTRPASAAPTPAAEDPGGGVPLQRVGRPA